MSRNMNEYKKSMENIVPSESFISETEALMKQALAEKRTGNVSPDKKRSRITLRTTAALSAAAAVFICIAAAGVYNNSRVDQDMVTEDVSADETVYQTEAISETESPSETESITVSENYDISETTSSAITGEITEETAPVYDESSVDVSEETEEEEVEEVVEDAVPVSFTADTVQTESTVTEPVISVTEASFTDNENDIQVIDEYDDAQVEAQEAYDEGTADSAGAPVYVPSFDDADYGYDSIDNEEAAEETEESYPMPMTLSLKSYNPDMFSTLNEVYVPDYVTGLDNGSYSLTVTAGYDEFDEETGAVISGGQVYLSSDMTSQNQQIIYSVDSITAASPSSHIDKESVMYNYRYKISVNSAVADEDNALLFEIIYDSESMIINRYDNGTVSSERYELNETNYTELDTVLSSLF